MIRLRKQLNLQNVFILIIFLGFLAPLLISSNSIRGGSFDMVVFSSNPHLCEDCHIRNHDLIVNATICLDCHANTWNIVKLSEHDKLLTDGEIEVFSGVVKTRYCLTCHDVHKNKLWMRYVNGTTVEFESYRELCFKCHKL